MEDISFRPFEAGDETAFRELNQAWIGAYFQMEKKDHEVLGDPVTHVLNRGGHILMALQAGAPVGCCALLAMNDGGFELAKMTIAETHRGLGLGRKLLAWTIHYATKLGAKRLYLETNEKLANAVHVYESMGFQRLPPERTVPSPYARSNVYMEMRLE